MTERNNKRRRAGGSCLVVTTLCAIILLSFLINVYLLHLVGILSTTNSPNSKASMTLWSEEVPLSLMRTTLCSPPDTTSSTASITRNAGYEYQPLSCREFLQQMKNGSLPFGDPNEGKGFIRLTSTDPKFHISLHNLTVDRMRWSVYERGDYYESLLTSGIKEGLMEHPGGIFLDVGGNIGWFSLWAAALGNNVAVFEPNPINYMRLCEAMNLNGWSNPIGGDARIDMYPFGVGSSHGEEFTIRMGENNNPGSTELLAKGELGRRRNVFAGDARVKMVSLDEIADANGWFRGGTTIGFMKVDVEGKEPDVFKGAPMLMKSGVVKNIAFEYNQGQYNAAGHDTIQQLGNYGYALHKFGRFKGPRNMNIPQANETLKENLERVITIKRSVNLWLKLKE